MIRITDPNDPRIAAYRDIRERDLVRRDGLFVAEGTTVLNVLLSQDRFALQSILVLENRLDGFRAMAGDRLRDNVPLYVTDRAVMDAIAGFPMHRGVLAVGARPAQADDPAALLAAMPEKALIVIAVGIANHDNMGAIFRNAAAFAADAVLLDETACDPLYRKAIRVSVGGAFKVPFARGGDASELVELVAERGFVPLALSPRGETALADVAPHDRMALILGTEGTGLPDTVMARTRTLRIPMANDFDSLNVATAGAIALSRLYRG